MLSGRSTVVAALGSNSVFVVLQRCRMRLGLASGTMELQHGLERVHADANVRDWPGIQPVGEISEYQLVLM
eukprot:84189-Amphidinium_carterae.1